MWMGLQCSSYSHLHPEPTFQPAYLKRSCNIASHSSAVVCLLLAPIFCFIVIHVQSVCLANLLVFRPSQQSYACAIFWKCLHCLCDSLQSHVCAVSLFVFQTNSRLPRLCDILHTHYYNCKNKPYNSSYNWTFSFFALCSLALLIVSTASWIFRDMTLNNIFALPKEICIFICMRQSLFLSFPFFNVLLILFLATSIRFIHEILNLGMEMFSATIT